MHAFSLEPADLQVLTRRAAAGEYWIVSRDGRIWSFGLPFWGSPTAPHETIGLFASLGNRGYALVGPRSWTVFGPNPPEAPSWLGGRSAIKIQPSTSGCWALFENGDIADPSGTNYRPPRDSRFVDFTPTPQGPCWLTHDGEIVGACQHASTPGREAVKILDVEGELLTIFSDGGIRLNNTGESDESLVGKLITAASSATVTPQGDGIWVTTKLGAIYGWGKAVHGGNLQNPRVDECVIALCAPRT